jgi:hypothetical protein
LEVLSPLFLLTARTPTPPGAVHALLSTKMPPLTLGSYDRDAFVTEIEVA